MSDMENYTVGRFTITDIIDNNDISLPPNPDNTDLNTSPALPKSTSITATHSLDGRFAIRNRLPQPKTPRSPQSPRERQVRWIKSKIDNVAQHRTPPKTSFSRTLSPIPE